MKQNKVDIMFLCKVTNESDSISLIFIAHMSIKLHNFCFLFLLINIEYV